MNPAAAHPPAPGGHALVSDKQLGDVTLLEPAARLLAARSGQPCALHVNPAFRPLVDLMPHALWGPQTGTAAVSWTTSWSTRAVWMSLRAAARKRCLLVNQQRHLRAWFPLLFREIKVEPIRREYWAHYFWRALGGAEAEFRSPRLNTPPEEWRHPRLPEGPFVLINPTAAWPSKFWSPESWARLAATGLAGGQPWVMTGGGSPAEREHCARITAQAPAGLVDLAGQTTLREYLHALSRARLVICVDGSASHLAQAFDVPVLTLFGPVFPPKWHWPTPRHRALSAFDFSTEKLPPASAVPVEAVLEELRAHFEL